MKQVLKLIIAAAVMGTSASAVAADEKLYAGIGVGVFGIEYSQPNLSLNQNNPGALLYFGVDYTDYFGAEMRLGISTAGESTVGASKVEMSTSLISLLAKFQYPVADDFRIYGLLGGSSATLNRKQTTTVGAVLIDDKATKASFSFGAGANFKINEKMSLGAEWMQYCTKTDFGTNISAKIWGAGANFTYHF